VKECDRPGYSEKRIQACSASQREFYCGTECQKKDWKTRKKICHVVELIIDAPLPLYKDVCSIIEGAFLRTEAPVDKLSDKVCAKLLQHTATFTERQFGKRTTGRVVYEGDNGDRIMNSEVVMLFPIYQKLGDHVWKSDANSTTTMHYLQKALVILESWRLQMFSKESEQIDVFKEEMTDILLLALATIENNLSTMWKHQDDYDKAIHYCK
jgi:hypothetical protein